LAAVHYNILYPTFHLIVWQLTFESERLASINAISYAAIVNITSCFANFFIEQL